VRIVVDTNLLVSGVISAGGPPRQLVDAAKAGAFDLCTSEPLLAELLSMFCRARSSPRDWRRHC
jgi:predicted nucleic acid-binding protein